MNALGYPRCYIQAGVLAWALVMGGRRPATDRANCRDDLLKQMMRKIVLCCVCVRCVGDEVVSDEVTLPLVMWNFYPPPPD